MWKLTQTSDSNLENWQSVKFFISISLGIVIMFIMSLQDLDGEDKKWKTLK